MLESRGIVGNYILERELGRGGMGVVYAAKHRVLGKPAAIKVLLANTIEHRDRVERFFNEARAAMAIKHPNVVEVYDVGIAADDRAYIAMELLEGSSLGARLARGPLPLRQAVDFARQIADALAAAHDAGVIHRDLKPENIIVARDRPILVDFGIAKLAGPVTFRTATGALIGTPLFMSPEQCEGTRELDPRTDLYSLGCVLFAMLTGQPPFASGGSGGVIGMHLHVAPPLLRTRCPPASEALERVISTLLAKSRDDRFRTARAASAALATPEVSAITGPVGVAATADFPSSSGTHSSPPPAFSIAYGPSTVGSVAPAPAPPSNTTVDTVSSRLYFPPVVTAGGFAQHTPAAIAPVAPRGRGRLFAIIGASCAVTAVVAVLLARSCTSTPAPIAAPAIDASTPADAATVVAVAPSDAAVAVDDRALRDGLREATAGSASQRKPDRKEPDRKHPDPKHATREHRVGSGSATATTKREPEVVREPEVEQPKPKPPPPRIHEIVIFPRDNFSSSSVPQDVVQRLVAAHRADPSRRVILTGHAENDERGALDALARSRANAVLMTITSGGRIPRDQIQFGTSIIAEPTADGANRRVDIVFAP